MCKWDIDERRQENGQVRRDEVYDEHFLDESDVVLFFGLVIFKLRKSFRYSSKNRTCDRQNGRKKDGGDENLTC